VRGTHTKIAPSGGLRLLQLQPRHAVISTTLAALVPLDAMDKNGGLLRWQ